VIHATVLPPSESPELALSTARALIHSSRTESAEILTNTRKRAKRYREKAKERGYRAGMERGLADGALECAKIIESLRELYSSTIDVAHRDAGIVAYRIVEALIDQHLRDRPELIATWIKRAVEHVNTTCGMSLRYHPRYHETICRITAHLPSGIVPSIDSSLGEVDFAIDTNVGAIAFSWRELLSSLKQTSSGAMRA